MRAIRTARPENPNKCLVRRKRATCRAGIFVAVLGAGVVLADVARADPFTVAVYGINSSGNALKGPQWIEAFNLTVDLKKQTVTAESIGGFNDPYSLVYGPKTGKGIDMFGSVMYYSRQATPSVAQTDGIGAAGKKEVFNAQTVATASGFKDGAKFSNGIGDIAGSSPTDVWLNPFDKVAQGKGLAFEFKLTPGGGWKTVKEVTLSKAGEQFDGMDVFTRNGKPMLIANERDAGYTLGGKNNCPAPIGPTGPRHSTYDLYDVSGANAVLVTAGFIEAIIDPVAKTEFPGSGIVYDNQHNIFIVSDICSNKLAVFAPDAKFTKATLVGETKELPPPPMKRNVCSLLDPKLIRCIEDISIVNSSE